MVRPERGRTRGVALIELTAAIGILAVVVAGFSAAYWVDQKVLRANYYRAIAMEIVDGEMEALVAGEWQAHAQGSHDYAVRADAARNLPKGRFRLTLSSTQLRLEWIPAQRGRGGRVVREAVVP